MHSSASISATSSASARGAHRLARRWRGKLSTSSVDVVHSPRMDCVVVGHKGTFPSHTLAPPKPHTCTTSTRTESTK